MTLKMYHHFCLGYILQIFWEKNGGQFCKSCCFYTCNTALWCIFLNDIMLYSIWCLTFNNSDNKINELYIPLTHRPYIQTLYVARLNSHFFFRMTDENMRGNIYVWPFWIKYETCYLLNEQCQRMQTHHRLDWTKFWWMSVGTARLQVKADMWHLLTETACRQVTVLCK